MRATSAVSGMSPHEIAFEIQRGGRFVVYQYCISLVFITFRRNSPVRFVRAGESAVTAGLPFTLLSLALGWWGIPFGIIYTPTVIYRNLKGGTDVTAAIIQRAAQSSTAPAARIAI